MLAIFKKDLKSYFVSSVGWITLAFVAMIGGFYFCYYMTAAKYVNLSGEIGLIQGLFMILIPLMTMRLFAEEKKNGTDVLIYTSGIPLYKAVAGKYLAALTMTVLMLLTTVLHAILTAAMGGRVDSAVFGTYMGAFLLAAVFVAIGVLISVMTETQITAAAATFIFILLITVLPSAAGAAEKLFVSSATSFNIFGLSSDLISRMGENISAAFDWIDPYARTERLSMGIFSPGPIVYCLSLSGLFLFLAYRILEKKRWSQR